MPEVTLDELAESVAQLRTAVEERTADPLDEEKVQRIAAEVLERQRAAASESNASSKRGFVPDDEDAAEELPGVPKAPHERMAFMLTRSAKRAAPLVGRPEADVRGFQEAADRLLIVAAIRQCNPRDTEFYATDFVPAMRAVSTTAGSGGDFVPRSLSANLIERVNLELIVPRLFAMVPMPTNPFDIPARGVARVRGGTMAENTADTGQVVMKKVTPGTRKVTLTARKFAAESLVSRDSEEDAIIAMIPFIEEELVDFLSADQEDASLNGDLAGVVAGSHMDRDVTTTDDPRVAWDGLRKLLQAGQKVDATNQILTVAHLRSNRSKMRKYGVRPSDLAHILSIQSYIQLLSDASVQTMERYGPNATIVTGELAKVDNVPIVISEYARADLNATGVFDNTTRDRTVALTVNRRGYVVGERRGLTLQLLKEVYAEEDQDALLLTLRRAFQARYPTTEPLVAAQYNLSAA